MILLHKSNERLKGTDPQIQITDLHKKDVSCGISASVDDKRLLLDVAASTRPDGQLAAVLETQQRGRGITNDVMLSSRVVLEPRTREGQTETHHFSQFVQQLVDLLAVREADVGLPHQSPDFLPDVIFVHLRQTFERSELHEAKQGKRRAQQSIRRHGGAGPPSALACMLSCCAAGWPGVCPRRPPDACGHVLPATGT